MPESRARIDKYRPGATDRLLSAGREAAVGRHSTGIPPVVDDALRTPGQPLDQSTLAAMEPRFGQDFSHVRVHSDALAARSARAIDAQAYTVGADLVFGAGQFAPDTPGGRRLLAHELAHAAQPRASGPARIARPGDASEREADSAADAVSAGASARPAVAGAAIQRQPLPGSSHESLPLSGGGDLLDNASPLLAAAAGSTTLDEFETGKAEIKPAHQTQLASAARNMQTLMRRYPLSTVTVTGYADTVDNAAKNLSIGAARAATVKQALIDLGIPDAIISANSKGEGAPQAVKTRDETPNAKNRRVEVQFHPVRSGLPPLGPQLRPPTLDQAAGGRASTDEYNPPGKPPIDIFHPNVTPPDDRPRPPFRPKQPDYFKPIPPLPKGSGPKSVIDVIGEKVLDPVIDAVAGGLSKDLRDKIKKGARSAVESGVAKGARAAAEAAGLKDTQGLDAIEKAAEAAIQEKGQSAP